MDDCALREDPSGTLSVFAAALGVVDGGVCPGERTRGAATAQITKASAARVIKAARAKFSDRLPQADLMYSILIRKRFQHYSPFEGRTPS